MGSLIVALISISKLNPQPQGWWPVRTGLDFECVTLHQPYPNRTHLPEQSIVYTVHTRARLGPHAVEYDAEAMPWEADLSHSSETCSGIPASWSVRALKLDRLTYN